MKTKLIDTMTCRYSTPILKQYGSKLVHYTRKKEVAAFSEWLNNTYNKRYSDVKEGETFILWNGDSLPVPFIQLKDECPDKHNRPTRLLDGCYLSLSKDMRIAIVSKETVISLKKEITQYLY